MVARRNGAALQPDPELFAAFMALIKYQQPIPKSIFGTNRSRIGRNKNNLRLSGAPVGFPGFTGRPK